MTTLWYHRPAEAWTEALPIGNGRLGGMVFGGVSEERIALNDDTFWSGGPADNTNPGAKRTLDEVRAFLAKGDYAAADEMSKRMMGPYTASYLPLGDLRITQDLGGDVTDYRRELNLSTAVVRSAFVVRGTYYSREVFCSNPDQVMVISLRADGPGRLDFAATLDSPLPSSTTWRDALQMSVTAPVLVDPSYYRRGKIVYDKRDNGMHAMVLVGVAECDGSVTAERRPGHAGKLIVSGATAVTLILSAATSFNGFRSPPRTKHDAAETRARLMLNLASRKSSENLRRAHIEGHAALFDRVSFSVGSSIDAPTDELLARRDQPQFFRRLSELLFDYGRYLLIASSRPGDQPANLQGVWNEKMPAPWSCNYTTNINMQMNYWPAEPANLAECHRPMLEFVKDLAVTGRDIAKVNYHCEGWCAHHNSDLWRNAAPVGDWGAPPADPVWAIWPMAGAWLCQHLWEHYAFNRDERYLREHAFPAMAGACRFLLDFLVDGPDGTLTTSPSTSPEHKFVSPDGGKRSLSVSSTGDLSLIYDLFTNTIEAARVLKCNPDAAAEVADSFACGASRPSESAASAAASVPLVSDPELITRLRNALDRLIVPRVLPDGRVAEWLHDFPGEDEQHRHVSHLFALHPGRQWQHDEPMKAAARKSLEVRGNASTGWSLAWKINLWARLGDGEQAMDCIDRLLTPVTEQGVSFAGGVYPNLFDAHPPFQIDGNFGYTAGVCEMLLQSHAGELHLLPALPAAWPNGDVCGLRARGGITVGLSWRQGKLMTATLRADRGQSIRVRIAEKTADFELLSGKDFVIDPARL